MLNKTEKIHVADKVCCEEYDAIADNQQIWLESLLNNDVRHFLSILSKRKQSPQGYNIFLDNKS